MQRYAALAVLSVCVSTQVCSQSAPSQAPPSSATASNEPTHRHTAIRRQFAANGYNLYYYSVRSRRRHRNERSRTEPVPFSSGLSRPCEQAFTLPSAVTLGGAYDGGRASPVDQQGHVICCRGRRPAAAAAGVGYSCARS